MTNHPSQPEAKPSSVNMSLVVAAAALLAACGGGGGGGGGSAPPPPPPPPAPVNGAGTVAVTPLNAATGVKRDANVVATATVTAGTLSTLTLQSFVCDGAAQANDAVLAGSTLTVTPKATSLMPYGKSCKAMGQATISGTNGGIQATVNWETTFTVEQPTCTAPQVFVVGIGACAYPMDVQVRGTSFKQLPVGCTSIAQQCWKDFVNAGNAVWLQTAQTMTGLPDARATRPIIFAGFTSATSKQQVKMFYADTGELVNTAADVDIGWVGEGVDYVMGNARGFYLKTINPVQCLQWRWNPPDGSSGGGANVWNYQILTCS